MDNYTKSKKPSSLLGKLLSDDNYDKERSERAMKKEEEKMNNRSKLLDFRWYTSLPEEDFHNKTWEMLYLGSREIRDCSDKIKTWDKTCPYGLFLHGEPGNGKTHMMKALIHSNYSSSCTFKFMSVSDVMDMMKDFDNKEYYHSELMKPFALILDDFGTEKASEYEQQQLFRILEHRKEVGKHVFMTSNLSSDDIQKKYSPRIISRLGEMMVFVENLAPSFRTQMNIENQDDFKQRNDKRLAEMMGKE